MLFVSLIFKRTHKFLGRVLIFRQKIKGYPLIDFKPTMLKSFGSRKMIIEGSLSFKRRQSNPFSLQTTISIKAPCLNEENFDPSANFKSKENDDSLLRSSSFPERIPALLLSEPSSPKDAAAVTLQKIYKSFRTRRHLADYAVLVEQRW